MYMYNVHVQVCIQCTCILISNRIFLSVVHVVLWVVYAVVQNVPTHVIVDMIVVSRELLLMHIVTVGRNVAVRH